MSSGYTWAHKHESRICDMPSWSWEHWPWISSYIALHLNRQRTLAICYRMVWWCMSKSQMDLNSRHSPMIFKLIYLQQCRVKADQFFLLSLPQSSVNKTVWTWSSKPVMPSFPSWGDTVPQAPLYLPDPPLMKPELGVYGLASILANILNPSNLKTKLLVWERNNSRLPRLSAITAKPSAMPRRFMPASKTSYMTKPTSDFLDSLLYNSSRCVLLKSAIWRYTSKFVWVAAATFLNLNDTAPGSSAKQFRREINAKNTRHFSVKFPMLLFPFRQATRK